MNTYQCPNCDKQLGSKHALEYHILHNVCQSKYVCPKCDKSFTSKRSRDTHVQNDVCAEKVKTKLHISLHKNPIQEQLNELYIENLRLKGEIKFLTEHPQTVNNSHQINIIVPPAFLEIEKYEIFAKKFPKLLHEALEKHPANFISYLTKETTCNPSRPLYNSVKLTNNKDPLLKISDGNRFVRASKKETIRKLIENKKDILADYVDQNGDQYGKKTLKKYEDYITALEEDDDVMNILEKDIICQLLNMSGTIGSDEWSQKLLEDLKKYNDDSCK